MNGRVYDYNLGRFLGVDPFLQFPHNSQSANPYSYIMNNPMAGTDPTGYSTQDEVDVINGGQVAETQQEEKAAIGNGQNNEKVRVRDNRSANKTGTMVSASVVRNAVISQHVYNGKGNLASVGVKKLSNSELEKKGLDPSMMNHDDSGFKSGLYQDEGSGEYIYAFAGTENGTDWAANFAQGLGRFSKQHQLAVDNTFAIRKAIGNSTLSTTGHSLGGGLASLAAAKYGLSSSTFNAAGLHSKTLERYQIKTSNHSKINSYFVRGEILSGIQDNTSLSGAIGNRIALPTTRGYFGGRFGLYTAYDSLQMHGMSDVLQSLNKLR